MPVAIHEHGQVYTEAGRLAVRIVKAALNRSREPWTVFLGACIDEVPDQISNAIPILVAGPNGITVIDVRRGDTGFVEESTGALEVAAVRTKAKADRVRAILTRTGLQVTVRAILAVHAEVNWQMQARPSGVRVVTVARLGTVVTSAGNARPAGDEMASACEAIQTALTDAAGLIGLGIIRALRPEDQTGLPFHATYRATHENAGNVVVHLHDLTAGNRDELIRVARRGFDVIHDLAPNSCIPPVAERFQVYPDPDGDLAFFAVGDDNYPTLVEQAADPDWNIVHRVHFAIKALNVLHALHHPYETGIRELVLRDISPRTVCVALDNEPYFSRFRFARVDTRKTIGEHSAEQWRPDDFSAPEVHDGGLTAATVASDVFSLCASLISVLDVPREAGVAESPLADIARNILKAGMADAEAERPGAQELAGRLNAVFDDDDDIDPGMDDDELQSIGLGNGEYVMVRTLGQGGINTAWLVREQFDDDDPEPPADDSDCLVGKIVLNPDDAIKVSKAHRMVRPFSALSNRLATVFEAPREWSPDSPAAIIEYVRGQSLRQLAPFLRNGLGHADPDLFVRTCFDWFVQTLEGVSYLHRGNLVHGDISPDNLMLRDGSIVIIDYDTVTRPDRVCGFLRPDYASPRRLQGGPSTKADDVYAGAASIFECLTGNLPFLRNNRVSRNNGLAWPDTGPFDSVPTFRELRRVLDLATHPEVSVRYADAYIALMDINPSLASAAS